MTDEEVRRFGGQEPTEDEASKIRADTLSTVRGTVQADQLKEAMGQNTLVFNLDTALKMMGMLLSFTLTTMSGTTTS